MKVVNNIISKLCIGLFTVALGCTCISSAHAERVKVKDVKFMPRSTPQVDVADDECILYVNLHLWGSADYTVTCIDKETGEESLTMEVPMIDGKLEVPLANLPIGTYDVVLKNGDYQLNITIEKVDEITDIFYDPFDGDLDQVKR